MAKRPNIVLVLADDLGFSDLGCYGGELDTPNLDALARGGARLSSFYNTARCAPSRASLLTGVHPHQAGIGVLTGDDRPAGYAGDLSSDVATLAEVLKGHGYRTGLSGKWHLSADVRTPSDSWPTRRGFDHFFGTLTGCGSYFSPGTLTRGEENVEHEADDPDFFYTTAITDDALRFIAGGDEEQPFFLYVAYTAPHWPLHALDEDIRAYDGRFDAGWDALRRERFARQLEAGVVPANSTLSPRDPDNPAWDDVDDKEWEARRMEVYAAQVTELDRGVGRIVDELSSRGLLDDTIVVFLSDNGASPEVVPHQNRAGFLQRTDIFRSHTRDGREVQLGSTPDIWPGAEDTYSSYGQAWANLSNTPYRLYKKWVHQGGIIAPFIVHWPGGGLAEGRLLDAPLQLTSVVPTLLEAVGCDHPGTAPGAEVKAPEGRSFLRGLRGEPIEEDGTLYWEHTGNAAIRRGRWKLVRFFGKPWELYDLEVDVTECDDVADEHADLVQDLAADWQAWADRVGVIPFERIVAQYEAKGLTVVEAEG
ncbi:arylsulfatase [Tessaracoccus oleiagri]|uniref:Arylsulfatase n=1 Tax=Tessaracoccus oleiagri TaxID=686624 RepID=A0A1G9HKN6_9ACTN|nr:arylsulfatase [Tessaracoccus oleiagri]SDL13561.1 arylsulfatase [Tessaracoccus oleiagri]